MIDPRAAMQPGLKACGTFSDVMQKSCQFRVRFRPERFCKLLCKACGSQQMRFNGLFSSIFSNMRKIIHLVLHIFVEFPNFIVVLLSKNCNSFRYIFGKNFYSDATLTVFGVLG